MQIRNLSIIVFCFATSVLWSANRSAFEYIGNCAQNRSSAKEEDALHKSASQNFMRIHSWNLMTGADEPGVAAEFDFESKAIRCGLQAVFFAGYARLFCPTANYQLPFFRLLKECAEQNSVLASSITSETQRDFVLVKVTDPVEICIHNLAYSLLEETTTGWPYWTNLRTAFYDEKLNNVKDHVKACLEKIPFPEGGALMPQLSNDVLFCSLSQYLWVKNAKVTFTKMSEI